MKSFENCFVFIRVFYSFLAYFLEFTIFRDIVEHAGGSRNKVARSTLQICIKKNQRWSRGHKARGQGQGQDKKKSEAKAKDSLSEDRASRGQGQECSRPRPRTKNTGPSVFQKKKFIKNFFQAISNSMAYPEF